MKNKNKIKKIISSLFVFLAIVPTILFSIPKKTYADPTDAAIDIPADTALTATLGTATATAVAAQASCGIFIFGSGDAGCPVAALNGYIYTQQMAVIAAADTKSVAKSSKKDPPASGWLTQAYHMVTSPNTVSTAVSSNASLAIKIEAAGKEVLRQAIIALEHQFISKMTQSTVNWINSGFHGNPLFVPNQESFFGNIEQSAIKNIINQVGYDPLQPFGKDFALSLINQYRASSEQDMQYSLSQVTNDPVLLNNYRTDFFSGGWNAFLINTQYPQNNYIGYNMKMSNIFYGQTTNNTSSPVPNLLKKATTLLSQGNGFLSPSMCPASINPNYNNMTNEFNPPTFDTSAANEKAYGNIPDCIPEPDTAPGCQNQSDINDAMDSGGIIPECIFIFSAGQSGGCSNQDTINQVIQSDDQQYADLQTNFNQTSTCIDPKTGQSALVSTTPGAIVSSHIMSALDSNGRLGELDAALGNSLSSILNTLMNHFLSEGLSGISNAVTGTSSAKDTWSYDGQTLTGNSTNTQNAIVVPMNLSLNAGDTSSTQISGGTAPYTLQTQSSDSEKIATATVSGSTLSVTGISQGTTSITLQDSSSTNKPTTIAVPTAQVSVITIGGSSGTAGTLSTTINSVTTSVLVNSSDTTTTAATLLTNAINANSNINKTVLATNTTPGIITITSQKAGTSGVFSLNSTNTVTALTATSNTTTTASDGNIPQNQIATITITVGTDGNILINFANLAGNPTSVTIGVGKITNLTMSGGVQPYNIQTEPDSTIALALLNNNTLTIVGVKAGKTSTTIQDSSGGSINLNIVVGNETPLIVSPSTISTTESETSTATISGGTPPYTITSPSSNNVMATISGNTLTATGSTPGSISITIQDSYSPAETINVPITVGNSTVTVDTSNINPNNTILVNVGGVSTTTLSGAINNSIPPFSIKTPPQPTVANATISNGILTINGVGQGHTSLVVQDSSTPALNTTFNITVTPAAGSNTSY